MKVNLQDREWKSRGITIGEFEDAWEANNRPELAEGLIISLKNMKTISKEEKVIFLVNGIIFRARSWFLEALEDEKSMEYRLLMGPYKTALTVFFELVPVWNYGLDDCCRKVLRELMSLPSCVAENLTGKIKTFVHSYLDTHKKEGVDEYGMGMLLVQNRMFEELVNYDFTDLETIGHLERLLFGVSFKTSTWQSSVNEMLKESITKALKENREPHAVSTLLRLLAKRGEVF